MYSLNDVVRKSYANFLVPRAVGYSAGLINYFFRGRLTITAPADGIYAILDHAVIDSSLNESAFKKIKLNLQNTTPKATPNATSYEDMIGGSFWAVAKYRRNPCYQSDLSGEVDYTGVPANGCDVNLILTAPEEISLSAELTGINLTGGASPTELSFDFTKDPIPVGITSLYLQVVYKGPMGAEKDPVGAAVPVNYAVVATTKDVSEPTYVVVLNSSDYFNLNGTLYTAQKIRTTPSLLAQVDSDGDGTPDINIDPVDITGFRLTVDNATDVVTKNVLRGMIPNQSETEYYRIAFIGDISPVTVTTRSYIYSGGVINYKTRECQVDAQKNSFQVCDSIWPFRGINSFMVFWSHSSFPAGSPSPDSSVMLDIPGKPVPQPVTLINF